MAHLYDGIDERQHLAKVRLVVIKSVFTAIKLGSYMMQQFYKMPIHRNSNNSTKDSSQTTT